MADSRHRSPGSPWDASGGSRFDHLGYWSADLDADSHRLVERGAPVDFDACPYGRSFTYHRLASVGARVELVDTAMQPGFLETWSRGGPPMTAIDLDSLRVVAMTDLATSATG